MNKAIIWVVILLALVFGGYYYIFYGKDQESPMPGNNTSGLDEKTIPSAIDNFYQKYESCLKNPPVAASGRVSEYCQNNSGFTTAGFAGNLEKGGIAKAGADPIFCAQGVPESMKASADFQAKNNKATGFMVEKFASSEVKIEVSLAGENGVWKVDNITCPPLLGGDRDAHGCIGSAGYSWCEEKQKCLRPWEEACTVDPNFAIGQIVAEKLAEKYNKPIGEVNVTVIKSDATHAAGSVLFGQGGPGEGGLFLAVKIGNDWQLAYDGNGSIDCKKMREQYKFSDAILKPNFCE